MKGSWQLLALIGLCACAGGGDTDTDTTDDTNTNDGPPVFEDFINTATLPTGDGACFTGTWLTQNLDATKVGTSPSAGQVLDFQEDTPVPDATLTLWYNDTVAGDPDTSGLSNTNGEVAVTLPTCQPFTYKTATNPDLEQTVDTFEAHQIFGPDVDGTVDATYNSVSDATYKIIPSLLGVSVDPDKGVIAGTAFDCNDAEIEHAQVVVKDAAGNIPESLVVKYFQDKFPNRDQPDTSPDGLWTAINVPEGDWTVEMYVADGAGGHTLVGSTVLTVYANSINISNIYTGFSNGVKYPAECLAP
jgi:hypothetical protein